MKCILKCFKGVTYILRDSLGFPEYTVNMLIFDICVLKVGQKGHLVGQHFLRTHVVVVTTIMMLFGCLIVVFVVFICSALPRKNRREVLL